MNTTQDEKYNFVLYVPEIKHDRWEEKDGKVTLYYEVTDPVKKFAAWLVKKPGTCDIEFDELCSSAWLLIDGERNIYEIAKIVSSKAGDDIDESLRRLIIYLKYLAKRGWVTFKRSKASSDLDSDLIIKD